MNSARQQRHHAAKNVSEHLARIVQYDFGAYVKRIDASSDLDSLMLDFCDCQRIYSFFHDRNIDLLSVEELRVIEMHCKAMIDLSDRFFRYTKGTSGSYTYRTQLQQEIEQHFRDTSAKLLPRLPTVAWTTADEELRAKARELETAVAAQMAQAKDLMKRTAIEAQSVIEQLKIHASSTAVESNAKDIVEEVKRFEGLAKNWFWSTVVGAAVLVLVAVYMIKLAYAPSEVSTGTAIHIAITKVVFLSTLSLFVVWCSKNYRACMHNIVANRQRISALRTYRLLAEGAPDGAIRGSIVLQAANATFAMRGTGFEDDKADVGIGNPALGVDGLIRAASGSRS